MKDEDIRKTPITNAIFTLKDLEEAHKAGMREIVEWLSNGGLCEHKIARRKCAICWSKKLKELE